MTQSHNKAVTIASFWQIASLSASSYARDMASMCGGEFSSLVLHEARLFCDQVAPSGYEELSTRSEQATRLINKIGSIAFADTMSRMCPAKAGEILDLARRYCEEASLTDVDLPMKSKALISTVGNICMFSRPM